MRTGISWTRWHAAFIPTPSKHGTDGSLRRTSRPSRKHSPLPPLFFFFFSFFSRPAVTPHPPPPHYYHKPFDADALLALIKRLVALEARWIPRARGCSLYIRPTLIGTRPSLGVSASRHAALYVILSPTGPYIRNAGGSGSKGISLLAMGDQVRAWPGGTGGFKLGLNYAPGFAAQRTAAAMGYQQLLWVLGETIAEAGAMNVFAVFERPDGGKYHS